MTFIGNQNIEIGLSWDLVHKEDPIDMDLSCVSYDSSGKILDAVFYNKLQSDDGSIIHTSDNRDGKAGGDDETIYINLQKVHQAVTAIVCNVSCYSQHNFTNVESSEIELRDASTKNSIANYRLGECGNNTSAIICILYRTADGWFVQNAFIPCLGRNFQDFKDTMRSAINFLINPVTQQEFHLNSDRVFNVSKGDIININNLKKVMFGLGWDSNCDVDSSCVLMTADNTVYETIYFGHLSNKDKSVKHSGDNMTGEGSGDDERIYVELDNIDSMVNSIIFTVTIYDDDDTFADVDGLFIRMVDLSTNKELFKYKIKDKKSLRNHNAIIVSKIYRSGGIWRFMAIGSPKDGNTVQNISKYLKRYAADDYKPKIKK